MKGIAIDEPGYLAINYDYIVEEVNNPLDVFRILWVIDYNYYYNVLQDLYSIEYRLHL